MDFNQLLQSSAATLTNLIAAEAERRAAVQWRPGIFTTVDWRGMANTCPLFCEIAGYHSWTQYFLSAQPPFIPELASVHFSWCLWYYNHASPGFKASLLSRALMVSQVTDPLYGAQGPVMEWREVPIPTKLYVNSMFPIEELRTLPMMQNLCEPFDLTKKGFAKTRQEEADDCLFFKSLVFMQIGEYAPVSHSRMMEAARRLRKLCSIPLGKLFNVTFMNVKSPPNSAPRDKALEDLHIREIMLWNKLMMDHVIHYDIKMKIKKPTENSATPTIDLT